MYMFFYHIGHSQAVDRVRDPSTTKKVLTTETNIKEVMVFTNSEQACFSKCTIIVIV